MQEWIIQVMGQYGTWGIFFLIFIENVFPPIPSEVILAFGGFMTLQSELTIAQVIIAATLGSAAGAMVLYAAGRWMGQHRLERFVKRYGKYLGLKMENVEKALRAYQAYEKRTVFFCRMMPIVRSLISIPAGMAGMKMPSFLLLTGLGSALWNTVLVYAGRALGHAWSGISAFMDTYALLLWGAIGILFALWLIRKEHKKKKGQKKQFAKQGTEEK